jgi:hypothetical protein
MISSGEEKRRVHVPSLFGSLYTCRDGEASYLVEAEVDIVKVDVIDGETARVPTRQCRCRRDGDAKSSTLLMTNRDTGAQLGCVKALFWQRRNIVPVSRCVESRMDQYESLRGRRAQDWKAGKF